MSQGKEKLRKVCLHSGRAYDLSHRHVAHAERLWPNEEALYPELLSDASLGSWRSSDGETEEEEGNKVVGVGKEVRGHGGV